MLHPPESVDSSTVLVLRHIDYSQCISFVGRILGID